MSDDTTPSLAAKRPTEEYLATLDPETREFFELMARDEPLHPDLMEYYEPDGVMGPQVRHPLVYEIGIIGPARVNLRYEQKKAAVAEARAEKDWFQFIWHHERPWRLFAFMGIMDELKNGEFWELMRDIWTDSENVWQHAPDWRTLFASKRPGRPQFMTAEERRALRKLPDELQVFRGCHEEFNDDGHSWTLDKERAEWFANRHSHDATPIVLVGTVNKKDVVGYITGRSESEIVVTKPEAVTVASIEFQ